MRMLLALTALPLCLPLMAHAQELDLLGAYRTTHQAVLGGFDSPGAYLSGRPHQILEGLEGKWHEIGVLFPHPSTMDEIPADIVAMSCDRVGITVTVPDPFTALFSMPAGKNDPVVTTYASRGGNVFGFMAPIQDTLARFGLDREGVEPQMLTVPLQMASGIATMDRVHDDLLVIQANYTAPRIYARCPE